MKEQDHKPFQFGKNPMEMTEFEKKRVQQEEQERYLAKAKYILGIQGVDGGKCVKEAKA